MSQFRAGQSETDPAIIASSRRQAVDYANLLTAVADQRLLRADWAGEKQSQSERMQQIANKVGLKMPGQE